MGGEQHVRRWAGLGGDGGGGGRRGGHGVMIKERCYCRLQSELRSCGKVEVVIVGSPFLIVLVVSVNVKQHRT